MSSAYNLEPQTNAKVILHTTHGDLDLELWATQTPQTCRNFLQHCLDGYYTDTIFHRLVPSFILQGGDPTGTGHGGEAIYPGGLFADEFHSRLRFNRRGLLGMANSGRRDDNGSQFFLTLGDTKELTGRNTMFGKVVGDTLYNLVRMGESEVEEGTERPVYPVKITGTEVVVNPFEDMKKREVMAKTDTLEGRGVKKAVGAKKKKKGKALLSFGGEEEGEDSAPVSKKPKFNTRLVVAAPMHEEKVEVQTEKKISEPSATGGKTTETVTSVTSKDIDTLSDAPNDKPEKPAPTRSRSPSTTPEPPSRQALQLAETNAQIAALKQSLRRDRDAPAPTAPKTKKKSLLAIQSSLLPSTSVKGRKRKRAAGDAGDETFDALKRFQQKLSSAATTSPPPPTTSAEGKDTRSSGGGGGNETKDAVEEDGEAALCDLHFIPHCASCGMYDRPSRSPSPEASGKLWSHTLSFEKDRLGKDLNWKKRNEELVIIDPREKEKEILGGKKRRGDGEWGRRREAGGGAGPSGSGGRERERR